EFADGVEGGAGAAEVDGRIAAEDAVEAGAADEEDAGAAGGVVLGGAEGAHGSWLPVPLTPPDSGRRHHGVRCPAAWGGGAGVLGGSARSMASSSLVRSVAEGEPWGAWPSPTGSWAWFVSEGS